MGFFGNSITSEDLIEGIAPDYYLQLIERDVLKASRNIYNIIMISIFGIQKAQSMNVSADDEKVIQRVRHFKEFVTKIIRRRIADKDSHKKYEDLLQNLINLQFNEPDEHKKLTEEEIIHNFITFYFAGMDTTAVFLTFAVYMLAKHPETLQKVEKEIDAHIKTEADINSETLSKLDYTHCVLKEVLRMFPPGQATFPRVCIEDHILGDKPEN